MIFVEGKESVWCFAIRLVLVVILSDITSRIPYLPKSVRTCILVGFIVPNRSKSNQREWSPMHKVKKNGLSITVKSKNKELFCPITLISLATVTGMKGGAWCTMLLYSRDCFRRPAT